MKSWFKMSTGLWGRLASAELVIHSEVHVFGALGFKSPHTARPENR